jgi:two-component system phosphate regulon sensor histidine kinase PhoR
VFLASALRGGSPLEGLLALILLDLGVLIVPIDTLRASASEDERGSPNRRAANVRWGPNLDALPDPAILLDGSASVAAYNEKAAELFDNLRQGVPIASVSRDPDLLEAVGSVRNGQLVRRVFLNDRVPLDRKLECHLASLPTEHDASHSAGQLLILKDLTEAARVQQLRSDFVAHASHELRTPLSSVIGFIETLQGPARDDPLARERFLGIMANQTQRMKRLVDDLLSLSRVEMQEHLRPRDLIDLNEIAEHVCDTMEPLALEEAVELQLRPAETPATVHGDWDELVQVAQNLVHNAIRYGRDGSIVTVLVESPTVGTSEAVPPVKLIVKDRGPGIEPQHLPRLTERFYRVDVATSRKKGGTGLGLAIVKHVVNRHRGRLVIQSTVGSGSTFIVELPRASGDARSTSPSEGS